MKQKKFLTVLLVMLVMLTGCGGKSDLKSTDHDDTSGQEKTEENSIVVDGEMFTKRDLNASYEEANSVVITLNGDSISCDSDAVKISGSTVTVLEEATYIFRGSLSNGQIIVNAKDSDKLQIVLDGASITSETSAPLYILEADKVVVTLVEGTENVLVNGGSFEVMDDNNIDGVVFSKQDLTFNGNGSLTVTSPVGHGIVCKDDLVFTGGTYVVESAFHGLDANDSVRVKNSAFKIVAGKDGIHVENSDDESKGFVYVADGSFDICAEGDGVSAGAYMDIAGGAFDIVSGGGSANATKQTSDSWGDFKGDPGMGPEHGGRSSDMYETAQSSDTTDDESTSIKGVKSTGSMCIKGGSFTINSADDAVHSNASITVNGGTFQITSGDDAFHADDTLTIEDGEIEVTESYEGLEGLHIKVNGGNIKLVSTDDGLNAAGGTDSSGTGGMRGGDQFGGHGGKGGPGGMSSNSDGSIVISDGNLYVNASGDGIDANGYLEIAGGYTVVVGPTRGDTATLDYDTTATISGGTFIGTGASGMAQTFSDSKQGVIAVSVGNCAAGTTIELKDSEGNTVISYAPELDFGVVILSNAEIVKGDMYKIIVGDASGEFEAN